MKVSFVQLTRFIMIVPTNSATCRFTLIDDWFLNLRQENKLSEFDSKVTRTFGTKRTRRVTSRVHKLYNEYLHTRNMLSKFSPNITSLTKSRKCENSDIVFARENKTLLIQDICQNT